MSSLYPQHQPKHLKTSHRPQEVYESFEEMDNSQSSYPSERLESSVSPVQLEAQIAELRTEFQAKLKEIDKIYAEIVKKEEEICNVTSKTSYANEDTILKKSHLRKMQQMQKDYDERLQLKLDKLKDDYNKEIASIDEEQDAKMKKIQENINDLKHQLDEYKDKEKFMTKEEHERILFDLRKSHQKELEPFEREIIELEQYINDNYPGIINKENNKTLSYFNEGEKLNTSSNAYSYKQMNKEHNIFKD